MSESHAHPSQNVEAGLSRGDLFRTAGPRPAAPYSWVCRSSWADGPARQWIQGPSIGADQHVTIQDTGGVLVEGKGPLDLKAPLIKMNGGAKPLATVGSAVGMGKVLTGSGTILGN